MDFYKNVSILILKFFRIEFFLNLITHHLSNVVCVCLSLSVLFLSNEQVLYLIILLLLSQNFQSFFLLFYFIAFYFCVLKLFHNDHSHLGFILFILEYSIKQQKIWQKFQT